MQRARQIGNGLHQIIVFGAGPGDADGVAFLKGVVADEVGRHLPGDHDQRNRIAQRIGQAGHRVGGARSGGDQHGADLAGGTCIAFGRVHRALLVPHENMVHFVLLKQSVVDRQHGAARITEKMLNALIGQCLDHHFRAAHFRHDLLPLSSAVIALLELRK